MSLVGTRGTTVTPQPTPTHALNGGPLFTTLTPATWMDRAACGGMAHDPDTDSDLFFPTDSNLPNITLAQAVCAPCDVKTECLLWAFENDIHDGIWGGLTEQQRFLMVGVNRRKDRRAKLKKRST